jgi:hypothetical protein
MRQFGGVVEAVVEWGEKTEKMVWITIRADGRRRSPAKFYHSR